jgi:hypothetical protein
MRLRGPGIYETITLPMARRTDELHTTHRDRNPLPRMPDAQATAEVLLARAHKFGGTPREALRRMLDVEMAKHTKQALAISPRNPSTLGQ